MAVSDIIQKMRGANMPRFVYDTTLPKAGHQALRDEIQGKLYKTPEGYRSYVLAPAKASQRSTMTVEAAALMGKELLLSGVSAFYQPLAGLLREVRLQNYMAERPPMSPVLDYVGNGYLVIVDFDDEGSRPNHTVWRDGLDLLASHVHRGGGLILACQMPLHPDLEGYTASFQQVAAGFSTHLVGA